MKKIFPYIALGAMCVFMLVGILWASMSRLPPDENPELPDPFVGTWRNVRNEDSIIVFHEDGTGIKGSTGNRFEITWEVSDGIVRTMPYSGRLSFDNDTLTARRAASAAGQATTTTFMFYSEATDLYEEEGWFFYFVALPLLILMLLYIVWGWVSKWKQKKHSRSRRIGDDL